MKKIVKITMASLMATLVLFTNTLKANAAEIPTNIVVGNYEIGYGSNPMGLNRSFQVKKDTSGKYMYCMDYHLYAPENTPYTSQGVTSNNAVAYIMSHAAHDSNDTQFFVNQVALWIYLLDNNLMKDSSAGSIKAYRNAVYSSAYDNNKLALEIRDLVAKAKAAGKQEDPYLTIDKEVTFTEQGSVYKSSVITVKNNIYDYKVEFEGAPEGTKANIVATGFYVTVPAKEKAPTNLGFKVKVTASKEVTSAYIYKANSSSYQPVVAPYTKTVTVSDETNLVIKSEVKEEVVTPTKVEKKSITITKRDKDTNKILEGASLVLLDGNGNVIDKWVSTKEAHVVYDLEEGKYTLKEISAPEGYELNENEIVFEVKKSASSQNINFYNDKEEEVVETPTEPEVVIDVPVESTSSSKSIALGLVGLGLVGSGATVIYRKTRKSE